MSDDRKYYYLKLKEDFFNQESIRLLESVENGIIYSNLYLKLCLLSLRDSGRLMYKKALPYDEKAISVITNINIDHVRTGLKTLIDLKMIEKIDNGAMYISDIENLIGSLTSEGERKRKYRERIGQEKGDLKEITCQNGTLSQICPGKWDIVPNLSTRDKRLEIINKRLEKENIRKENKQRKEVSISQINNFEMLWKRYPIQKGKQKAQEAFLKLKPNNELLGVMLNAVENQKLERIALANSGNFVPEWIYLQGWINQKRYLDIVKTKEEIENAESGRASRKHLRKNSVDSTIEFCNELRAANKQLREYVTNNIEIIDNTDEINKH